MFGLSMLVAIDVSAATSQSSHAKISNASRTISKRVAPRAKVVKSKPRARATVVPVRPSYGRLAGLRGSHDALDL